MESGLILGISGSARGNASEGIIKRALMGIDDEFGLKSAIEKLARDKVLSNSEVCLLAALYSVKKAGLNFEIISLKNFLRNASLKKSQDLERLVTRAAGIIIASPVYFGDTSHLVNWFIDFANQRSLLNGKVVGCVSVGAKRNGGQETTNIYTCKAVNDAGAYVVGNGPPTSQYGGTAWAGDIGAIREDDSGISTSMGTGKRVAEAVSLINSERYRFNESPLNVAFWVVQEKGKKVRNEIYDLVHHAEQQIKYPFKWDIINFTDMKFAACQACSKCPWFDNDKKVNKCKIKQDDFALTFNRLVNADAIILCGYGHAAQSTIKDVYQKTLERTRCLRRDNFLLSNIPVTSLSVKEMPSTSLFSLKVLTSFVRHNTIILPPLNTYLYEDNVLRRSQDRFLDFLDVALRIRKGKRSGSYDYEAVYVPVGYAL